MCGIAGALDQRHRPYPELPAALATMDRLIAHRGPDGNGFWTHEHGHLGFAHRRLKIIDLETGAQPMTDGQNWITYNGEIYNYLELRDELGHDDFRTRSDTEVILRAYRRWGRDCVSHLRGMFAFAIWDEQRGELFCTRDRFGMKPFYYTVVEDRFFFASEAKALLPFLATIETDAEALKDYLAFQFCLGGKTLFAGIRELPPGHSAVVRGDDLAITRYWNLFYEVDFAGTEHHFESAIRERMLDSVDVHLRADVPVGAYVSGGIDSSIVAALASDRVGDLRAYTGRFDLGPEYDESRYARELAETKGMQLTETTIDVADFIREIRRVIYHLDYPVAGPGAFPQFMVSKTAARDRKVVLGGQGGDELFGGYARYLIAYFEQCLKAAIDGTMNSGNFIVSYESILPNLGALRQYKPLLQEFWRDGLFQPMDERYFRLINRSPTVREEVRWDALGTYSPFDTFREIFNADNLGKGSYFDRMTHFDFKALLPALLQVEDRVSMAHGLESRLPFLDHPLVELSATIPSNIKFEGGRMKRVLRSTFANDVPASILQREDKMGFPTPLNAWAKGPARAFVFDTMSTLASFSRPYVDNRRVLDWLGSESKFGRSFWGIFSLELWHQEFHDQPQRFRIEEASTMEPTTT